MNKDTLTTMLGQAQAVGTAVLDYLVHAPMEGGVTQQPTYWIGLAVAALMGVKAYYTKGIETPTKEMQP